MLIDVYIEIVLNLIYQTNRIEKLFLNDDER